MRRLSYLVLAAVTAAASHLAGRWALDRLTTAAEEPHLLDDVADADTVTWLDCDGPCGRERAPHFDHGTGIATCATCGTDRPVPDDDFGSTDR